MQTQNPNAIASCPEVRMKAIAATQAAGGHRTLDVQAWTSTPPAVHLRRDEGPEAFEIMHARYTTFAKGPAKNRRTGYVGLVHRLVFDEAGARHELKTFFGLAEDAIDAIIKRARRDGGS